MPIYDCECTECGHVFEDICGMMDAHTCPECDKPAQRLITASGVYMGNEDATWLKSVLEVVDKSDQSPSTRRFIRNPTRKNYTRWMKANGLRPLEVGEKAPNRAVDRERLTRETMKMRQARHRIELGR